ncbi:UDP-glycosyltransferase 73C5-like [Camellia sinensis]|uniref:UDP-glycosyltransferase 73C5-like n=1 Tax=Camellia sinensis TaxID=4442 RepID=UPI001036133A|nr:UDP-glycosyltransferase 73C5-like [Camellia sinensis]
MASQKHQLHFVLVPLMSPGHFIPMIDMAKLLEQHGVTVTVVTNPVIVSRFHPTINRAIESGLALWLLPIRFPSVEAGRLEGCKTVDTLTSPHLLINFFYAVGMLQQPFEQLFEALEPFSCCIIADKHIGWVGDTGRKFQIPRIIFDGMSCLTLLCSHNLCISKFHDNISESEPFELPDLPDRIELTKAQLSILFTLGTPEWKAFQERVRAAEVESYGVVINSFEELEPRYAEQFRKVKGDKVWCIGPVSLYPGSVVYACLGSISGLSLRELIGIGLGLEASQHPFVWVIRDGSEAEKIEKWVKEDGFEERTKGRGLVIQGWAPQVLEIGVSIGVQVVGHLITEENCGELVEIDVIREVGGKVMGEGIDRGEKEKGKRTRGDGKEGNGSRGSSYLNMRLLIEDLIKQVNHKDSTPRF